MGFIGMPATRAPYFTVVSDTEITVVAPPGGSRVQKSVTVVWKNQTSHAAPTRFTYTSSETVQAMMTLAGLAAIDAAERPSNETGAQKAQRMQSGINGQLHNASSALAARNWTAFFVEFTPDRANMAYIA